MKVFGIGTHRTGTNSLNEALNILGINSIHYKHSFNILISLAADDRRHDALRECEILKEYDGFIDLIIPCIFKKLDYSFPDSKFILTTRDINSWINSVYNHTGGGWFSLFEYMFYGFWKYDKNKCIEAYTKHDKKVRAYFKNYPDKLLILDLACNNKWEKLCNFLNKNIPDQPYPYLNKYISEVSA